MQPIQVIKFHKSKPISIIPCTIAQNHISHHFYSLSILIWGLVGLPFKLSSKILAFSKCTQEP
jgi:hypothetical protein